MKRLNDMFHIDGERLIKTSNGQAVPEDEPVFILRGRDRNAVEAVDHYRWLCFTDGVDGERLEQLPQVVNAFTEFRRSHPERMKQPGCTRGA